MFVEEGEGGWLVQERAVGSFLTVVMVGFDCGGCGAALACCVACKE